jgi:hypothetical protein
VSTSVRAHSYVVVLKRRTRTLSRCWQWTVRKRRVCDKPSFISCMCGTSRRVQTVCKCRLQNAHQCDIAMQACHGPITSRLSTQCALLPCVCMNAGGVHRHKSCEGMVPVFVKPGCRGDSNRLPCPNAVALGKMLPFELSNALQYDLLAAFLQLSSEDELIQNQVCLRSV